MIAGLAHDLNGLDRRHRNARMKAINNVIGATPKDIDPLEQFRLSGPTPGQSNGMRPSTC